MKIEPQENLVDEVKKEHARMLYEVACDLLEYAVDPATPKDIQESNKITAAEKLLEAAKLGHVMAQLNIAGMYECGVGVPQSDQEAYKWYQIAAFEESSDAQFFLAGMISEGRGCAEDPHLAAKWYHRSAQGGHVEAQFQYSVLCLVGQGVPEDEVKAFEWGIKAAQANHAAAQYNLGYMYYNGEGTSIDLEEACKWFSISADQGYPDALFMLGSMYLMGEIAEEKHNKNFVCTIYRLWTAAVQGFVEAQALLGNMFDKGMRDLPSDKVAAAYWYSKAADNGHAESQRRYGELLFEGAGHLPRNIREAARWTLLARESGVKIDRKILKSAKELFEMDRLNAREMLGKAEARVPPSRNSTLKIPAPALH